MCEPAAATLTESLAGWARRAPEQICCQFVLPSGELQPLTYGELYSSALAYGDILQRRGAGHGSVVVIAVRHRLDLFYAFWGAMLAGAIPAMLAPRANRQNPAIYGQSLRHLLDTHPVHTVIAGPEEMDALGRIAGDASGRLLAVLPDESPVSHGSFSPSPSQADGVAFLQFSSGTTGHRKGVMLTHRQVGAHLAALSGALGLEGTDRIFSWLPLYHDMGLIAGFLLPIVRGIPLVLMDPLAWVNEPASMFRLIESQRCTHAWLPNFAFNHMANVLRPQEQFDLSSMKAWINCSEPCKAGSADLFCQRFSGSGVRPETMINCYAMAEAVFAVTQTPPGRQVSRVYGKRTADGSRIEAAPAGEAGVECYLSVGLPLPGLRYRICNGDGDTCQEGEIGEIVLAGDGLLSVGYYQNPSAKEAAFRPDGYHTGDLGFSVGGELYVLGRSKDVIIVNGRNIYAHDIEQSVQGLPGVKAGRVLALGVENTFKGSEELVLLVESLPLEDDKRRVVVRGLKERVEQEYGLTLARVEFVEPGWLAKTTSGKPDRVRNKARYLERKAGS